LQQLQNYFRRALEVEEGNQTRSKVRLSVDGEQGVYFKEKETALGVLIGGGLTTINTTLIKRIIPSFKGFSLVVISFTMASIQKA